MPNTWEDNLIDERDTLAAQLADARAALGEISSIGDTDPYAAYSRCRCPGDTDDARESAQFELGEIARKVLAAPAPRADLIAAAVKLAEASIAKEAGAAFDSRGHVQLYDNWIEACLAYRAVKKVPK